MIYMKHAMYMIFGICLGCLILESRAYGQIVIIVNKSNGVENISKKQLLNYYLGNDIAWPDAKRVQMVTLRTGQSITRQFFETGLKMKINRIKRMWLKLLLSGKTSPPKVFNDVEKVLHYVQNNNGAIGFIPAEKLDNRVKAVKVDAIPFGSKNYFLRPKSD